MTPLQQKKYWWEWARCREFLAAKGYTADQADAERHNLHRKALGQDKSSTKFSNADFDAVIGVFRAVWDGGNLNAQLRQIDQPEMRSAAVRARIDALLPFIGVAAGREHQYLAGMSRRIFGTDQIQNLNAVQLARLEGILIRRVHQIHPADYAKEVLAKVRKTEPITLKKAAPVPESYEDEESPF